MCGIFSFFAWALDLINGVWAFLMSCCASCAVGLVLFIGISSGIALGYSYAIAEYEHIQGQSAVDSNVTVYFKRGIFGELPEDKQDIFRRSMPLTNIAKDQSNSSGRRLDDSIITDQGARKRFEGSLIKFQAKKGDLAYSTSTSYVDNEDEEQIKIINDLKPGSMEQLKLLQSLINRRRNQIMTVNTKNTPTLNTVSQLYVQQPSSVNLVNRRVMNYNEVERYTPIPLRNSPTKGESLREYVPGSGIGDPIKWFLPKVPSNIRKDFDSQYNNDPNFSPTYPPPVTPRRPLKPSMNTIRHRTTKKTYSTTTEDNLLKLDFKDIFHTDPYIHDLDAPSGEDVRNQLIENYDVPIEGLPVRRKRNDQAVKCLLSNILLLHDHEINKTANEMNNQTVNVNKNVTTVLEYVTKANGSEAFTVKEVATLSHFTYRCTLIKEKFDVLSRMMYKTAYNLV